jgi:hypothetical protein
VGIGGNQAAASMGSRCWAHVHMAFTVSRTGGYT